MKIVALILIIPVVLIVLFFIPFTEDEDIRIAANFHNTTMQVMHPENWKKWFPAIRQVWMKDTSSVSIHVDKPNKTFTIYAGEDRYYVKVITPLSYLAEQISAKEKSSFLFTVRSQLSPDTVTVSIRTASRLLYHIFPMLQQQNSSAPILGLKAYLEDAVAYYGYRFVIEPVSDTILLTRLFSCNNKNIFNRLRENAAAIQELLLKNKLTQTNFTCASYREINRDSMAILLGIPVKNIPAAGISPANVMRMPKGRMLTGHYSGRFDERTGIYRAIKEYIEDKHLKQVAAAFEMYLDNTMPVADSSNIRIRIYFPIL